VANQVIIHVRVSFYVLGIGTQLFLRYLDQETAKRHFRYSSHAATCYYQSITTQR